MANFNLFFISFIKIAVSYELTPCIESIIWLTERFNTLCLDSLPKVNLSDLF